MKRPAPPVRIAAVAGVLVAALVGLVVREGVARAQGREVRLAIQGYDPRSPLSGHYVEFQLAEGLPSSVCPKGPGVATARLWFTARPDGGRHRIVAAAHSRPAARAPGEVLIRGTANCYRNAPDAQLDVGVTRMHLAQDEAERLEKALRGAADPGALVVLSVGEDGRARLKGLIVRGRRMDVDWL